MRTKERGFTLIELMVVLSIVAVLISAVSLGVTVAMKQMRKTTTQTRVTELGRWLDEVSKSVNLGAPPATDTTKLRGPGNPKKAIKWGEKVGRANDTNVGIETLYVAIAIPELSGVKRPELNDDAYGNTDDDDLQEKVGSMPSNQAREIIDAWGNPLVYFCASDYKDAKKVGSYQLSGADGEVVTCEPLKSATPGEFRRPDSFQLFSMGPDGKPGTDDDIHYGF
jgi:prepilin-type N-terminal cleavage/methylation domain-containing protein